ncbi:MAG: hypothetical protein NTU80_01555 [Verrucomicrobia bacterium]|nr:hypothetical protein [Verrucomicrobiota bacterium]
MTAPPAASHDTANDRPVVILGGGLAGLSLGLALRRAAVPVTLHEAGDYPRHRVCGEFIAGLDARTIQRLELAPFLADARQHTQVAWYHRATLRSRHTLPAPALAIDRHRLDQRLAAAFLAAGGTLLTRSRHTLTQDAPGYVFAHGRRPAANSPWLGLKCHARGITLNSDLEMHLGTRAYVGLCALDNGWVNVSGLFHQRTVVAEDRASILPAYLRSAGLADLANRLAAAEIAPASHCAIAGLDFGRPPNRPSSSSSAGLRLGLGDCVSPIPPFTGNGMAMAFQSAALALNPLLAWTRGAAEWPATVATIQHRLRRHFRTRLATARLLHPALLNPAGQRTLTALAHAGLLPFNRLYRLLH